MDGKGREARGGRTEDFARRGRASGLGLPDLASWIRFRRGQEGPSTNREHMVNPISAGLDRG
jgi:hypothetical protein